MLLRMLRILILIGSTLCVYSCRRAVVRFELFHNINTVSLNLVFFLILPTLRLDVKRKVSTIHSFHLSLRLPRRECIVLLCGNEIERDG